MWQWVARNRYIPLTENYSLFGLMLFCLGNVNYACMHICMYVCM